MADSNTYQNLLAAKKAIAGKTIPKNRTAKVKMKGGGEYSYKYADLADVLHAVIPPLQDNNLILIHPIRDGAVCATIKDQQGNVVEESSLALPDFGSDAQALGSLLTYYKRYLTYAVLGIHPDDDDDGRGSSEGDQDKKGNGRQRPFQPENAKGGEGPPSQPLNDAKQATRKLLAQDQLTDDQVEQEMANIQEQCGDDLEKWRTMYGSILSRQREEQGQTT